MLLQAKMLWAGDNAVILHRFCQCSAIFPSRNGSSPYVSCALPQRGLRKRLMHIPAKIVGAACNHFFCNGCADLIFKLIVK